MKRALLVLLICALVGALFLFPLIAHAVSWTTTFDGGDILSYTVDLGTITATGNPGNGLDGGPAYGPTCEDDGSYVQATVSLPAAYTITLAELDTMGTGGGTGGWHIRLLNASDVQVGFYTGSISLDGNWSTVGSGAISVADVTHIEFLSGACGSASTLHKYADNLAITGSISGTATPTLTPTGTPNPSTLGWNSPLRAVDQYEPLHRGSSSFAQTNGVIDYSENSNLTVVFSNNSGQNVFAVAAGTVADVSPTYCQGGVYSALGEGRCLFRWTGDGGPGWSYWNRSGPLYAITVTLDNDYSIIYIVKNPQVSAGQTVQAGCLIGQTWDADSIDQVISLGFPPQISITTDATELSQGVALIQMRDPDTITSVDGTLLWVLEPSGIACAVAEGRSCSLVANASLQRNNGYWEIMPGHPNVLDISWLDGGGVRGNTAIEQVLSLDSQAEYNISIGYRISQDAYPSALPQQISVQLGTTTIPVSFSNAGVGLKTIDAASYTPDRADGYYSFGFFGESTLPGAWLTDILFLCVSDTTEDPPVPGGGCMVNDPNFSVNPLDTPWVLSADPPAIIPPLEGNGGGFAVIPDTGYIYDQITLYPKDGGAQQDYTLTVTMRRQGVVQTDHNVGIFWEFDTQSGTLGPSTQQIWQDYTDTISVADDPITADLYLTADGSHPTEVAQVSMVCIRPTDVVTPPGYRPPPPFDTTTGCRLCVYSPTGDVATDLTEYVQWLNCQFYQLWECQAKILLRYIWTAVVNILTLLGFLRMWLNALIVGAIGWGNGNLLIFAHWLSSEFNNLGIRISNALTSTISVTNIISGGGATLGDVLIALINGLRDIVNQIISGVGTPIIQLLQQLVSGIFDLIRMIILLAGTFITVLTGGILGILANIFGLVLGIFQAILNGIASAATSVDTSWFPDCTSPTSGVSIVVCSAIYGVESNLGVGPFALFVPIGIGLAALNLLLWGINKIRGSLTGA